MTRVKYLSTQECAAKIGSTRATIIDLINDHQITALRVGRTFKIKPEDFEAYLKRNITVAKEA